MRLHKLTLAAFGPFAGSESVDFDALAGTGLFLLEGRTGAGKTSILDAITYALYGEAAGARGSGTDHLRSHFASDDQLTSVELEFTVRGRRFKIQRDPRQMRRKARGDGLTPHGPTATLKVLDGSTWKALGTKKAEVDPLVTDLIGLDAAQFQQVILLPQGEFARFLRADPKERRPLLQKVFDTERFGSIEAWLTEQATKLAERLGGLDGKVSAAVAECAGALDVPQPEGDNPAIWLDTQRQRLDAELAEANRQHTEADKNHKAASAKLTQLTEIGRLQRRHAEACERRSQHAADLGALPDLRRRLDNAQRAAGVRALVSQITEQATLRDKHQRDLVAAEDALAALRPDLTGTDDATLTAERDRLTTLMVELERLDAVERNDLPRLETEATEATQRLAAACGRIEELINDLAALDASLDTDQHLAADGRQANGMLTAAEKNRLTLGDRLKAANDRHRLQGQIDEVTAEVARALEHQKETQTRYNEVLARRISGISAELAQTLNDGDPCPVCGSADHPHPAEPTSDHASASDLEEANQAVGKAGGDVERLTSTIEGLRSRVAEITDFLGDDTLEGITLAHQAAVDEVAELEKRTRDGEAAERRLGDAEGKRQKLDEERSKVEADRSGLNVAKTTAIGRLEQTQQQVAAARDGSAAVADRLGVVKGHHDAINGVLTARTDERAAATAVTDLTRRAVDEATQAGFVDLEAATSAIVSDGELAALTQQTTNLETVANEIDTVLNDPEVVAAVAQPAVDLSGAEAAANATSNVRDSTLRAVGDIENQLKALQRCDNALTDADIESGDLRQRHQVVHGLAQLASGNQAGGATGVRMSLTNYVLSARLTEVTDAASTRLAAMTDGRYTLLQTDESGHGGRQGGLGIAVRDTFAPERTRSTQSLSGGESFAASLALALGLADVVAAESGGVSMETLFIDEGFGTLDDEALNGVLDILDSLRSGGRTVGVVSHVTTMKERITTHLKVTSGPRGSTITQ